ncbi:hypothetical protein LSM04_009237 [Trypanosoma melophagium]|uniref:uncharacterized protein n=1 Tax=Trypanosoma melophagium TaxID=715481 RepID=UPI00351AA61F|nr:hypothetical protein LSM04_009237 [Trypanosoma melophagium]
MSAEVHQYNPYAYGGQPTPGGDVAPIVCSSLSGTYPAPASGGAESARFDNPPRRIPCCCEGFREGTSPAHHSNDQHQHFHHHQYHHHSHHNPNNPEYQQSHFSGYYGQYGEGTDGQMPQKYRSSSRRCYCCVPEQEELQECERLAREKRYQSLRAERDQLKTALYDDFWKSEVQHRSGAPSHRYRSNTADLLRYSQGTFYQQAVAMEQDRRRQQLRREIEERRRELNAQTHTSYPIFTSTRSTKAPRMMMTRSKVRPRTSARGPVVICATESLKNHNFCFQRNQRDTGGISTGAAATKGTNTGCSSPQTHVRRQERISVQPVKKSSNPTGEQTGVTGVEAPETERNVTDAVTSTQPITAHKFNVKKWRSLPPSPRGVTRSKGCCCCCCCCCCHVCQPCASSMRPNAARSAGAMADAKQVTVAPPPPQQQQQQKQSQHKSQPKLQHQTQPQSTSTVISKNKEEAAVPARSVSTTRGTASPLSQSQLTLVNHGRKVYITDDAYLFRRSQVIDRLEQDGYVRRLSPTTRSPSAPLPEKTRKWTTTRSTSAHRVCV